MAAENLITNEQTDGDLKLRDGFSPTVLDSMDAPGTTHRGVGWDGTNVISADLNGNKTNLLTGFTTTIQDSVTNVDFQSPSGCGWDGSNVIFTDRGLDEHHQYDGFSDTVTDSFAAKEANPYEANWNDTTAEFLVCGQSDDDLVLYDTFTNTVNDSISSPIGNPRGVCYDGTADYIYCVSNEHQLLDGFTTTILDSFNEGGTSHFGCAWDGQFAGGAPATVLRDMIMRGGVIPFLR